MCRSRALADDDRTHNIHLDTNAQARRSHQNTSALIPTRIESTSNVLPLLTSLPACVGAPPSNFLIRGRRLGGFSVVTPHASNRSFNSSFRNVRIGVVLGCGSAS